MSFRQRDTAAWSCGLDRQKSQLHDDLLTPENTDDIVIEGQDHKQNQQNQADLLGNFPGRIDRGLRKISSKKLKNR